MPMVGMVSSLVTWAGDVAGHHLHDDREGAGLLDRVGVVEDAVGGVAAALHAVAAEAVLALRGEADVGHHRDAAAGAAARSGGHLGAALELDGVGAGLLHEADGGEVALLGRGLVGAERQVADDERAAYAAATARVRGSSSSTVTGSEVSLP